MSVRSLFALVLAVVLSLDGHPSFAQDANSKEPVSKVATVVGTNHTERAKKGLVLFKSRVRDLLV